ncbi:unnamed protein product [Arctogadus glacialis]
METEGGNTVLPDPPTQREKDIKEEDEKAYGNIFTELESVDLPLGTTLRQVSVTLGSEPTDRSLLPWGLNPQVSATLGSEPTDRSLLPWGLNPQVSATLGSEPTDRQVSVTLGSEPTDRQVTVTLVSGPTGLCYPGSEPTDRSLIPGVCPHRSLLPWGLPPQVSLTLGSEPTDRQVSVILVFATIDRSLYCGCQLPPAAAFRTAGVCPQRRVSVLRVTAAALSGLR